MNVDTGEVREMTDDEVRRLNAEAGRKLWEPLPAEMQADLDRQIKTAERDTYKEEATTRANRRAAARKMNGKSRFEMALQGRA